MALQELVSVTENMENLSVTYDTLHKIIKNILASPHYPKYRNLPKNAKAIQEKCCSMLRLLNLSNFLGSKWKLIHFLNLVKRLLKKQLKFCKHLPCL